MLLRLEGPSFESNYVPLQNNSMEINENKSKKAWQEKWKGSKGEKGESEILAKSKFIVYPDHLRRCGTLSNRVLAKKLRHNQTRFYGTVGARSTPGQRPSLLLSPVFVPSSPIIVNHSSNYLNSTTSFFNSQTLNKNYSLDFNSFIFNGRKPNNQRLSVQSNDLRINDCNECHKDVRQNTLTLCENCAEKKSILKRNNEAFTEESITDPYNLMRRNRLGRNEINEGSKIKREKRNANISPLHESLRGTHQTKGKVFVRKKTYEEEWMNKNSGIRRKSILECDVNPYDLNESKSRGERDLNDSDEEFPSALTDLKMLRPKLTKVEGRKIMEKKLENEKLNPCQEIKKKSEIILNGQRLNIFDRSHSSPPSVSQSLSGDTNSKKPVTEILLSEQDFPKRPPRRQKGQAFKEIGLKYSKSKSQSSPNLYVKSILKKAMENENPAVLDLLFSDKNSSVFAEIDSFSEKSLLEFSNSNKKKHVKNSLKKKKQVQFKVTNAGESAKEFYVSSHDSVGNAKENIFPSEIDLYMPKEETKEEKTLFRRSRSYEDLSLSVNDHTTENSSRKLTIHVGRQRDLHTEDTFREESTLKKSFSDRHLPYNFIMSQDELLYNYDNSSTSSLFYDTMALRRRALKLDSRNMFQIKKIDNLVLPRQKLSEKYHGKFITYEEFKKLSDESNCDEQNYFFGISSRMNDFVKDYKKNKIKSVAPSPPPRQVIKSNKSEVSVQILAEKNEIEVTTVRDSPEMIEKEKSGEAILSKCDTTECETKDVDGKIVVNLVTSPQKDPEEFSFDTEKSSFVTIHSKNDVEEVEKLSKKQTFPTFNKLHLNDTNKVIISVRNENELMEDPFNSSTCTIIETGSNSAVIPIVSTNNKTTLIVGSSASSAPNNVLEQPSFCTPILPVEKKENDLQMEKPTQYFFSEHYSKGDESFKREQEIDVRRMDPVEAVRRNLIPHVCGKEDGHTTLLKKIKQMREAKEQKNMEAAFQIVNFCNETKEISAASSESYGLNFQNDKTSLQQHDKTEPRLEDDSSSIISCSNSFCSTLNSSAKNSSTDTSRSSSFRSNQNCCLEGNFEKNHVSPVIKTNFYSFADLDDTSGPEKNKLECEYEIQNELMDKKKIDLKNIYEILSHNKGNSGKNSEGVDAELGHSLVLPPALNEIAEHGSNKSIFEGASKYDILNYLVDAKERVREDSYFRETLLGEDIESNKRLNTTKDERIITEETKQSDLSEGLHQLRYLSEDISQGCVPSGKESAKSSTEIERKDSGVGSETSNISRSKWQLSSSTRENLEHLCEDCDQIVETQITNSGVMYVPMICRKCSKKRSERKEIIQEIVDTEEKYGRDLKIVLEEFCKPMLVAGLLTPDQLSAIFLNTEELLENSKQFTEKLKDTLEVAFEQGDEDLLTVNMGKLFLEMGPMLHAFQNYCTRQGAAAILLANLEKEKELLRIFLRVSQMENTILRRMNLNSFLMVPVQRVTKYPLLLARLYKVTPSHQEGRELLKEAQRNIEVHLEHMNSETKDMSTTKVWRRFSTSTITPRKSIIELELNNIKLRKIAIDILEWSHDEVRFVIEGKLLYTQPTENNLKKGKTVKLSPVFALLVTLGKPNSKYKIDPGEHELMFPSKTGIREATILLLKEKFGRYSLIREPLYLDKIIVCCESDVNDYFEIQELSTKDSYIFKSDDGEKTKEWYKQLQYHAQILGAWRKRRNALANIMINGMMARASLN